MEARFELDMKDRNAVNVSVTSFHDICDVDDKIAFVKTVSRLLGLISEDGDIIFINPDELADHQDVFEEDV